MHDIPYAGERTSEASGLMGERASAGRHRRAASGDDWDIAQNSTAQHSTAQYGVVRMDLGTSDDETRRFGQPADD